MRGHEAAAFKLRSAAPKLVQRISSLINVEIIHHTHGSERFGGPRVPPKCEFFGLESVDQPLHVIEEASIPLLELWPVCWRRKQPRTRSPGSSLPPDPTSAHPLLVHDIRSLEAQKSACSNHHHLPRRTRGSVKTHLTSRATNLDAKSNPRCARRSST